MTLDKKDNNEIENESKFAKYVGIYMGRCQPGKSGYLGEEPRFDIFGAAKFIWAILKSVMKRR